MSSPIDTLCEGTPYLVFAYSEVRTTIAMREYSTVTERVLVGDHQLRRGYIDGRGAPSGKLTMLITAVKHDLAEDEPEDKRADANHRFRDERSRDAGSRSSEETQNCLLLGSHAVIVTRLCGMQCEFPPRRDLLNKHGFFSLIAVGFHQAAKMPEQREPCSSIYASRLRATRCRRCGHSRGARTGLPSLLSPSPSHPMLSEGVFT